MQDCKDGDMRTEAPLTIIINVFVIVLLGRVDLFVWGGDRL